MTFKKLLLGIFILAILIIIYIKLPFSKTRKEFESKVLMLLEESLPQNRKITKDDINELPEVLQKYLVNNGLCDIGDAGTIIFMFYEADFKMGRGKDKLKIEHAVYNFLRTNSRCAIINTTKYGLPFEGIDEYIIGRGRMKGIIAKHITLFDVTGKDMDKSALVTYLAESIFHPSGLLKSNIDFRQLDNYSVEATITNRGQSATGVFYFNERYEMTSFKAKRFSDETKSYEDWEVIASDYKREKNINRPTRLQAKWHYKDGELLYFDSTNFSIQSL
ncbi:hypothetical protein PV797_20080 [Clostridiaceae bacterium M8S5]|nr:hypothetical protein PV797_20080 [Clostridiaceae bacterium M8S5]